MSPRPTLKGTFSQLTMKKNHVAVPMNCSSGRRIEGPGGVGDHRRGPAQETGDGFEPPDVGDGGILPQEVLPVDTHPETSVLFPVAVQMCMLAPDSMQADHEEMAVGMPPSVTVVRRMSLPESSGGLACVVPVIAGVAAGISLAAAGDMALSREPELPFRQRLRERLGIPRERLYGARQVHSREDQAQAHASRP